MKKLNVQYFKQINSAACGAACLEMVYKYYGLEDISQEQIFEKYKATDPHNSKGVRMLTNDIVLDAKSMGFKSSVIIADFKDTNTAITLLDIFLTDSIPLIVCQQYNLLAPLAGHFRVVVGIDDQDVYFHDPDDKIENGQLLQLSHSKFLELWQPTGENVTGGRFVWIKK